MCGYDDFFDFADPKLMAETTPRKTPESQKEQENNPLLQNPIVAAGLLSIATGEKITPQIYGAAGTQAMQDILRSGVPVRGIDIKLVK